MVKYTILFIVHFMESDKIPSTVSGPAFNKLTNENQYTPDLFVFNVKNKVKQYIHIKYKSFSQQINNVYIICGGKVAKVFTEQETAVVKTVDLYENHNWLVFAIKHNDKIMSHESAMRYFESQASFRFTFNKNNFPPKVEVENLHYLCTGKIPSRDICTVRENVIPKIQQIAMLDESNPDKKMKKPQFKSSNNFRLDHQQACEAYDTIIELAKENGVSETDTGGLDRGTDLIDKAETSSTTVYLDGKSLFYDEQFFKVILRNPSNRCNNMAVIVDASSFYNAEMKKYFIPLVIRIPRLYLLPIQELQDLNIKHLYLQSESKANLLFNTEIKIGPISVKKRNVHINYKDVFLINPHNVAAASEFLLTESVVLKLTCNPIKQTMDPATLYGKHITDTIMGTRPAQFSTHRKYPQLLQDSDDGRYPQAVRSTSNKLYAPIIGCASFDLSALVHRSQHINIIRPFTGYQTTNQQVHTSKEYVFKEHTIRESGMYIELRVSIGSQLNIGLDWNNGLFLQHYMNRAVIICQRPYTWVLLDFYKKLIEHNNQISHRSNESKKNLQSKNHGFFSGYIVDCVEYTIMFVEGLHHSLRLKLGQHFSQHEPIILYDRMMIFEKVLYDKFNEYGGFYQITMSRPLEEFLYNDTFYCEGSAAHKGLLKLDLTRKCKSIKEFCDCNLAAKEDELQNLDDELGLPIQFS